MSILQRKQTGYERESPEIPEYRFTEEEREQEQTSMLLSRRLGKQDGTSLLQFSVQFPDDSGNEDRPSERQLNATSGYPTDPTFSISDYPPPKAELQNPQENQFTIDHKENRREHRSERRRVLLGYLSCITQWMLIVACIYVAFLIYGVMVTNYEYDSAGNVVPQSITAEELSAAAEFGRIQGYYLRARDLYEKTLKLDFRLANNPEAALLIASDYELLLEDVAKLSMDLSAAQFGAGYSQLHRQLLYWVQTDIAVYLQNISAAITQNSVEKGDQAIIGRDIMYNDFMLISENIAVYGSSIKGVSLGDICEWSPDKYVQEVLEGIQDEK